MSSAWVLCFVAIRFDLDIGPVVEHVAPSNALTEEGKRTVTQCAFPDCNPESGHDLIFFFRIKDCTAAAEQREVGTPIAPLTRRSQRLIYGATYYRQKKDVSVPRGYVQQAVVLLSPLPYMTVHELILRVVVPRFCQCCTLSPDTEKVHVLSALSPEPTTFFEIDSSFNPSLYTQMDVLRHAVEEIEAWPTPHPHVQYSVTLLHQLITFVTPTRCLAPPNGAQLRLLGEGRLPMRVDDGVTFLGRMRQRMSAHGAIPLYALLSEQLRHLTQLWELLLCHEPIFIWSNTPSMASATAFAVSSLVEPLEFSGTLRSYFTVQDEEFARFSRMGLAIPFPDNWGGIVAATNPFFFRAFSGWRNVLTVVDRRARSSGSAAVMEESVNISPNTLNHTEGRSGTDGEVMSPRLFTYTSFFPALAAATNALSRQVSSASFQSSDSRDAMLREATNSFRSPFPFLVDHTEQTAALLRRLEQASRLDKEAQLVSLCTWGNRSPAGTEEGSRKESLVGITDGKVGGGSSHNNSNGGTDTDTDMCTGVAMETTTSTCKRNDRDVGAGGENGGGDNMGNHGVINHVTSDGSGSSSVANGGKSSLMRKALLEENPFSQYSIADDIVRKFFTTLTMEFLMPVSAWFQAVTSTLSIFHLCDAAAKTALTPESFLQFLRSHRETVPPFLSRHPFKAYSAMYERFAKGSLFQSTVWQLIDKKVRQGLEEMQMEEWAAQFTSEAERFDMFLNLYSLVQREVLQSIDPDIVFVTIAKSVLVGMAVYIQEPLRDELLLKIRELKI